MTDEWTTVDKSRLKKQNRVVSSRRAMDLQQSLGILGLYGSLMSNESLNLQANGWTYRNVIKYGPEQSPGTLDPKDTKEELYTVIIIPNKWKDRILFSRPVLGD